MQNILLVDDHNALRCALVEKLESILSDIKFVHTGTASEAILMLQKNPEISTAVLDMDLGETSGLELLAELRKINCDLKALIFSMHTEPMKIQEALNCNIQGYISKDESFDILKKAIETVANGELYFGSEALWILKKSYESQRLYLPENGEVSTKLVFARFKTLSRKEQEIFALLAADKQLKDIAKLLNKSQKTVENQRNSIYKKLDIHGHDELIEFAKVIGIV